MPIAQSNNILLGIIQFVSNYMFKKLKEDVSHHKSYIAEN